MDQIRHLGGVSCFCCSDFAERTVVGYLEREARLTMYALESVYGVIASTTIWISRGMLTTEFLSTRINCRIKGVLVE